MANIFNRIWSKADFWDKQENANQQAQFNQQDAEEKKRKQQQAAAAARTASVVNPSAPEPGAIVKPQSFTDSVGSQSSSNPAQPNPLALFNPNQPIEKASPTKEAQPKPQPVTKNGMTGTLVNNHFVPDAPKKPGFFGKVGNYLKWGAQSGGEAVEGLGLAAARTGTGIAQGVVDTPGMVAHASDWVANKATGNTGNSRFTKGIDKATKVVNHPLDAANEALDRTAVDHGGTGGYKAEQVLLNAATLIPAAEAVATKIPKVGEAVSKANLLLDGLKGTDKIDKALRVASFGKFGQALPAFSDAKSGSEIIHAAEDLPEEALAATGVGAFAGDAVSKARYGESPLTGESAASEGAQIPGSSGANPNAPTTEVTPGIKTKNIPSEPPQINVDNTPAYQRGTPTTVGEADAQNRLTGGTNVPDEVFSADARVGSAPAETSVEKALDVPTFLRNGADQAVEKAQSNIAGIDERIANVNANPQIQAFNDRQAIADAYKESPNKGKATERYIAARNARNPEGAVVKAQALGDRRLATQDLTAAQDAQAARDTLANIPDPTSPIVPAKAEPPISTALPADAATVTDPSQVVADFRQAIQGSPEKAVPAPAPVAEAVATPADAAAAAAPPPTPLVPADAVNPNLADTAQPVENPAPAADATQTPPVTTNTPGEANAPRTRAQAASLIDDQQLQTDVLDSFPQKKTMNIEETHNAAKSIVNDQTPQEVVAGYPDGIGIKEPVDFFKAVESVKRLQTMRDASGEIVPEAKNAIANAIDAMTEFSGKAGQSLRTVQILFDDMPSSMKVAYLTKKLARAGAELSDADRARLDTLIQASDSATDELRGLQDEANALLDNGVINNANLDPATKEYVDNLVSKIDQANRQRELSAGEAWKEYQNHLPKGSTGKRVGDTARSLMLSSPSGRLFDILSTSATSADDLATRGISNLIGKAVNRVNGAGTVESVVSSPRALVKGFQEGVQRTKDAFQGKDYVTDFMGQAKRATRGDISTGGGKFRQVVRGAVEAPTNLTKGLETEQLYRQGVQEANQIGLTGDSADLYGKLRAAVPTDLQRNAAEQVHLRANMLHDNGISKALNNVANALDQKGGGWAAPLIRNQIAPFTSWVGGNLHRTLTDKNVLFNVFKIADGAVKGDAQVVVDNIARLGVNTAEAYGAGMLLTKAGIITNQDANGNSYGGLYFHIGNRYIPVAVAGTVSVPLILGNAFNQASDAASNGEDAPKAFFDALAGNTAKNAGVASSFGGQNTLQSSINEATTPGGSPSAGVADYFAGVAGQFIPSATGDVNSVLDQTALNPDHIAPQTKVTEENPATGKQVTDPFATAARRTANKIPGVSQVLPRDETGKLANDPLDRILKSTHQNDDQATKQATKQSLSDIKKQLTKDKVPLSADDVSAAMKDGDYEGAEKGLKYQILEEQSSDKPSKSKIAGLQDKLTQATLEKQGVPVTDDGIEARTESGDYDQANAGLNYQYDKIKDDKNVPDSKKQAVKDKITTIGVLKDGGFDPSVVKLYSSTSNSDWRDMGDSESDMYDPDTYNMLKQYDDALSAAGVSGSTKKGTLNKFIPKSASGTSRGGKANGGINTSIATQSFNAGGVGFSPLKAESAANNLPNSAIPTIERVPNFDTSKIRKITVT
jgi:hypothetical protein